MAIPPITIQSSSTPDNPVHMVFAVPSFITGIFKNLSGLELAAVQTVCRSWHQHTHDTDVLFLKKKRAEVWHEFHKVCGRIESFTDDPKCDASLGVAKAYIRLNTSNALQKARNLRKRKHSMIALQYYIKRHVRICPENARQAAESDDRIRRKSLLTFLAAEEAKFDIQRAFQTRELISDRHGPDDALLYIIKEQAKYDIESAIQSALSLHSEGAWKSIAEEQAKTDIKKALQTIDQHLDPHFPVRYRALAAAAIAQASYDLEGAYQTAHTITHKYNLVSALVGIALEQEKRSPSDASDALLLILREMAEIHDEALPEVYTFAKVAKLQMKVNVLDACHSIESVLFHENIDLDEQKEVAKDLGLAVLELAKSDVRGAQQIIDRVSQNLNESFTHIFASVRAQFDLQGTSNMTLQSNDLTIKAMIWAIIAGEQAKDNIRAALQSLTLSLKIAQMVNHGRIGRINAPCLLKKLITTLAVAIEKTSDKINPPEI